MWNAGVTSHGPSSTSPVSVIVKMSDAVISPHQMPHGLTSRVSSPGALPGDVAGQVLAEAEVVEVAKRAGQLLLVGQLAADARHRLGHPRRGAANCRLV